MRPGGFFVLAAVLMVALLISMVYGILIANGDRDLASDNTGPSGTSEFKKDLEGSGHTVDVLLSSPTLMLDEREAEDILYVSLGRGRGYSPTAVQDLRKFHSRGGRMLIADDSTRSSSLSVPFDVDYLEGQLYDERFVDSPDLVQVDVNWRDFSGTIVLNRPTGMAAARGEVMARSGPASWVDRNGNGRRDPENISAGEFPSQKIIALLTDPDFAETGEGCVIFLSDPSLFTNEMIDLGDNREFLRFIISLLLPSGGRIVIDESTHGLSGLAGVAQRLFRGPVLLTTDINLKIVVGTLSTVLLIAVVYLYNAPPRLRHVTYLNRSGLAQLIDTEVGKEQFPLMRTVVLDRIRIRAGLSVEAFSKLPWKDIEGMIDDPEIYRFIRGNDRMDPATIMERIEEWSAR